MTETLPALLSAAAEECGEATALIYEDRHMSWRSLEQASGRFAADLKTAGMRPGDRLMICAQNVPGFVVALLGAAKAGIVAVPVNPMYRSQELAKLAQDCEPAGIVCEAGVMADLAAQVLPGIVQFPIDEDGYLAIATTTPASPPDVRDPMMIVYTSGTTGRAKGAVITHRQLIAGVGFYRHATGLRPGQPILACAPLFHVTGLSGHIGIAIAARCPLILTYRFRPEACVALIERYRPVFTVAAITALDAILDAQNFQASLFASFSAVFTGGAPVAPSKRERFERMTRVPLRNVYGLTETVAPITACASGVEIPVDSESGALSVGKAVPHTNVRIVNESGEECADGEEGEIAVQGPSVFAGYWPDADHADGTEARPTFLTGDIGKRDADGWFYIVDRKKDMIVASGFKVWPREVEDVLYMHPAIREVAVVGVPDDYRGETVMAVISLNAGQTLDRDELDCFCRERLAAYKIPRIVKIIDDLPKTATGKIRRRDVA